MAINWHGPTADVPADEPNPGLEEVRTRWPDAPADDAHLTEILAVAQRECEAYAPSETDPEHPGEASCRTAQLMQARNLWNAGAVAPTGDYGDENTGFSYSAWPLDRDVKQRLRPLRGRPWVV